MHVWILKSKCEIQNLTIIKAENMGSIHLGLGYELEEAVFEELKFTLLIKMNLLLNFTL